MTHERYARAIDVADRLIRVASEHSIPITPLHVQKLLYYAQGWHFAFFGRALFSDDFEAWPYGPVVPDVYHRYKAAKGDPLRGTDGDMGSALSPSQQRFVERVWRTYRHLSAGQLSDMTHQEPPWREARGGLGPAESSREVVPKDSIALYFRSERDRSERRLGEFGITADQVRQAIDDADAGRLTRLETLG